MSFTSPSSRISNLTLSSRASSSRKWSVAIPAILWIYTGWGLNTVFIALAVMVAIAAVAVTQIGPEARGLALDEVAPPTA